MVDTLNRRDILIQTGVLASFLGLVSPVRALTGSAGDALTSLLPRIDTLTSGLRGQELSAQDWRDALDAVFDQIDLPDLLRDLDFEALSAATGYADQGVATAPLRLNAPDGQTLSFFPKMFAVGNGRAIIPHGHDNMVSAHLTLDGRFHVRQYDKIAVEGDALLIRPSIDRIAEPGDLCSIGTQADNVHWFVAEENSHTLDIVVMGLGPDSGGSFDIYNIDPDNAVSVDGDILRAPRLGLSRALAQYG